jgi:hypothetical protein
MKNQFEDIEIRKPLYDNFVYIRDKIIFDAIRNHRVLRITIPQGTAIVNPENWLRTGKRMEKVFKIPDKPMVLIGNYVPIKIK